MEWLGLVILCVGCILSIWLIAKGIETTLRGMKHSNPNRTNDLLFGFFLLIPGIAIAGSVFFWFLPIFGP